MEHALKIIFQTSVAFFVILILTRILGKQQISQLTFYEYINGITFGSIAATMATDTEQKLWEHMIGLVFFGLLTALMSIISLRNRVLRKVITGEPVVVIQEGKIFENNLKKMRLNFDELMSELRNQSVFNIADVYLAIIEPNGKLSVLLKQGKQPVIRDDLGIKSNFPGADIEVIADGQLIYTNLRNMGLNAKWLKEELSKQNINSLQEVAYATVNKNHELFVDLYEDDIPGMIDTSDDVNIPFTMDNMGKEYSQE